MTHPPRVGDHYVARLAGRVSRELILSLDPKRNVNLGKPNAGRSPDATGKPTPRWHRKLWCVTVPGADYAGGWEWHSRCDAIDIELEAKEEA